MKILAVNDLLALYIQACDTLIEAITGSYIGSGSDLGCKIMVHFGDVIISYSGWVLCVITLEHILALALLLKTGLLCTKIQ